MMIAKPVMDENRQTVFLDKAIPLNGASHGDVVNYSAESPMRYAQCFATLADGRKVGLLDSHQFIGWSDASGRRSLLFRSGFRRIEIQGPQEFCGEFSNAQIGIEVFSWPSLMIGSRDLMITQRNKSRTTGATRERKFVARDGSLLLVHGWAQSLARRIGDLRGSHAMNAFDPGGMTRNSQA